MRQPITTLVLMASSTLVAGRVAADEKQQPRTPAEITKKTPDQLPPGIARFNGMLVGRLLSKDLEKGTFVLHVDAVPRVWRNSKAEDPQSIVGKNVEVNGVSGKWLDVLLVVKQGETLECEARHDGGNRLTFPGELLRKVAPYDPLDYPRLPEGFRGFQGAVAAKVIKKDPEMFELIIQVDRVIDIWKKNRAKNAESIAGRQLMLAGFWRRKDQYHRLKVGDSIEVGLQHIGLRSDHLTVAEFVRKTAGPAAKDASRRGSRSDRQPQASASTGLPAELRGFEGALVGRLVSKDVERGTFVLRFEQVLSTTKQSKARDPQSCRGRQLKIRGIRNRYLDELLLFKVGDRLEVGAIHLDGEQLNFSLYAGKFRKLD